MARGAFPAAFAWPAAVGRHGHGPGRILRRLGVGPGDAAAGWPPGRATTRQPPGDQPTLRIQVRQEPPIASQATSSDAASSYQGERWTLDSPEGVCPGQPVVEVSERTVDTLPESELLVAARRGDPAAFEQLVSRHRRELYAHCYRMLGSVQDAEDALQESLLGAWRGLANFEGRGSVRAWLYQITTNACLRLISRRPRRILSPDYGPPRRNTDDLGDPVTGPIWLEPWPDDEPAGAPGAVDPRPGTCGGRA